MGDFVFFRPKRAFTDRSGHEKVATTTGLGTAWGRYSKKQKTLSDFVEDFFNARLASRPAPDWRHLAGSPPRRT